MDLVEMPLRSRVSQTVMVFFVAVFTGFCPAIIGPTLPDLQLVFDVDLKRANFLLLAIGLGELFGVCLSWVLVSRVDANLLMSILMTVGIAMISVVPLTGSYYAAAVAVLIYSTAIGVILIAYTNQVNILWPHKSYPVHFAIAGSAAGSVLAPLIARPFLCAHDTISNNTSGPNELNNTQHGDPACDHTSTNIVHLFVISGCIHVPTVGWLLYSYFCYRNAERREYIKGTTEAEGTSNTSINKSIFCFFVAFLFLFSIPSFANVLTFGSLLSTFGMESDMHSITYMADMTSTYWASLLGGKILCLLISGIVTQLQLIMLALVGLLATGAVLITVAPKYTLALWIGTSAFGFFSSPFPAVTFAWSRDHVILSGKMISLCYFGTTIGNVLEPFIAGLLVSYWGPNMLIYFLAGAVFFQCSTFLSLYVLSKMISLK